MVRSLAKMHEDAILEAIVSKTDNPSYGYNLVQGATTLTETWDASRADSWNHAMLGHIDSWFFEHVAGLKTTSVAGPILLVPTPIRSLSYGQVSRDLPTGRLTMRWERQRPSPNGPFSVSVSVPPNAVVHLVLPSSDIERVHANGVSLSDVNPSHVRVLSADVYPAYPGVALHLAPGLHTFEVSMQF